MYTAENRNQRIRLAQKIFVPNLIVNLILPWLLYVVLRPYFTSDTLPLALSTAIPTIMTIVQWVWQHRVNWMGLFSTSILVIALIVTYFSGGNALPLKIIQPAIFGLISLAFLISAGIGKPLLLVIFSTIGRQNKGHFNHPLVRKKMTLMTLLFGGVLLIGSTTHIILALVLPTSTFLAINNMVSVGTIVALIICAKLIVPRIR